MIRFEDICDNPEPEVAKILELIDAPAESVGEMSKLVRRPSSIGRWKTFDEDQVRKVVSLGEEYLAEFGYA